jgi:hypothetical protein
MTHEWIPDAVTAIAARIEIGKPIGDKLLTLKSIWNILARKADQLDQLDDTDQLDDASELSKRLAGLPTRWRLDTWGIDTIGVSLPDQALAAFYCATVIELGIEKAPLNKDGERTPLTKSRVAELTRPIRAAAEQCRASLASPGRPGVDENLARALEICAEFSDEEVHFIECVNDRSAYFLPRSSADRNDDNVRTKVRALAKNNQLIFGECMYGTLATMAASVLGSSKPRKATVRGWCEGVSISDAA